MSVSKKSYVFNAYVWIFNSSPFNKFKSKLGWVQHLKKEEDLIAI